MSTPDLLRLLLLLLLGLLGVIAGILPSAFDKQNSLRGKSFIFVLGVICGILFLIGTNFIGTAKADQNAEWIQNVAWTLGLGYAFSLPTMLYFLITKEKAETPSPRNLLLKAVQEEVSERLETSLHNQKMIDLAAKELPHHVGGMPISEQPQPINWVEQSKKWISQFLIRSNSEIATTDDGEDIPAKETIIDVFKNKDGKLLILGEPGAGKTTTLLDLAKDLCVDAIANENKPIPIIVDLFSWKDNRLSLPDWLAVELKNKYGVRADIIKELLDNHQLLPLLDGFDELEENRQLNCIRQINEFLETDARAQHLVVCSRLKEFEQCNTPLRLNGAVCLQPLETTQMQKYLREVGCLNLWDGIKDTPDLLELAKSPLLLTIMALASGSISILDWQKLTTSVERRRYLFDAYINQMFKREIKHLFKCHYHQLKEPNDVDNLQWLVKLSKQLKNKNQTEFLIEKMQADWLQMNYQKWIYRIIPGLILGLFGSLVFGLVTELTITRVLFFGLSVGLLFGAIGEMNGKIQPMETLKWSWINAWNGLIRGLIPGLIIGLSGISLGLKMGLIYGIFTVVIVVIIVGTRGPMINITGRIKPNQGIWNSFKICIFSILLFGLISTIFYTLLSQKTGISFELRQIIMIGLSNGVFFGVSYGGYACIQHFTLRLILWQHGDIPWNYAKFLNYVSERLFMQRIGGRYRFIHDLLREHFANM